MYTCERIPISQELDFENEEMGNLIVSGCVPTELVSLGFAWEEMLGRGRIRKL